MSSHNEIRAQSICERKVPRSWRSNYWRLPGLRLNHQVRWILREIPGWEKKRAMWHPEKNLLLIRRFHLKMSYLRSSTKTYFFKSRTTPNSELVLNESEQVIADSRLPNLIGNGVDTRKYREVFSLPAREHHASRRSRWRVSGLQGGFRLLIKPRSLWLWMNLSSNEF